MRRSLLLAAAVALAACADAPPPTPPLQATPPNIIVLLTDDQRADALGAAGNEVIRTPHLDALARDGVRFTNAYVTTSICATSRASLFSGQYARRHGIHGFGTDFSAEQLATTYPAQLKAAGYRIGFVGKWGVGGSPPDSLFDYWRGFGGQGRYEQTDSLGQPIHLTRVMGRQALEFVRASATSGRPFALSVSFKAPHVQDGDPRQFIYDPALEDLYADDVIPEPKTANGWNRQPDFFTASNEARERWELRFATPEQYQQSVKGYYRLISGVDRVVGELVRELDTLGLADDTVILFTSDNGFFLGEHGLAGKWYGHEPSIRVPLIVRDPALPAPSRGRTVDAIALNIDVAPTLLNRAGVAIPDTMQGRSLLPLLHGEPAADWRADFFYEHLFERGPDAPAIPRSEGVAGGRYKYLRYIDEAPPYEILYDLQMDPLETRNLIDAPAATAVADSLRRRFDVLRTGAM